MFLEAAPEGLDPEEIGNALAAQPGVVEVHDLHVWEVTSGFPALSAHVLVAPGDDCHELRRSLQRMLADRFQIGHTTLQVDHAAAEQPPLRIEVAPARSYRAPGAGLDSAHEGHQARARLRGAPRRPRRRRDLADDGRGAEHLYGDLQGPAPLSVAPSLSRALRKRRLHDRGEVARALGRAPRERGRARARGPRLRAARARPTYWRTSRTSPPSTWSRGTRRRRTRSSSPGRSSR